MPHLKVAFDIDDTLYRITQLDDGSWAQVPDYELNQILLWFVLNGHKVFVWSAGGTDYALQIARKLGISTIVTPIQKEMRGDIDISFDDEEVLLAKVNVRVRRPQREL